MGQTVDFVNSLKNPWGGFFIITYINRKLKVDFNEKYMLKYGI